MSLNYNQGKLARSYNSLSLNYLNRKVNLFGNFSYGRYADFNDDVSNRTFYGSSAQKSASVGLENYGTSGSNEFNGRIGMDYTLIFQNNSGFIVNGSTRRRKEYVDYVSNSYSTGDVLDSTGWGGSVNSSDWRQLNGNINLQHKFDNAGRN